MVEKAAAEAVRDARGEDAAARRAIGAAVLQEKADLWRRVRVAVLHRLRLRADILKLASACAVATSMQQQEKRERGGNEKTESVVLGDGVLSWWC